MPPNVRFFARFTFFAIPIIGYVYSPFAELPNYAPVVRFVSIPVLVLSGFWMYAGVFFAIIGVAVWLGAFYLSGIGAAILPRHPHHSKV